MLAVFLSELAQNLALIVLSNLQCRRVSGVGVVYLMYVGRWVYNAVEDEHHSFARVHFENVMLEDRCHGVY